MVARAFEAGDYRRYRQAQHYSQRTPRRRAPSGQRCRLSHAIAPH